MVLCRKALHERFSPFCLLQLQQGSLKHIKFNKKKFILTKYNKLSNNIELLNQLQWATLNGITLGQIITDTIYQMITITK
jgi:hypothetical protein